MMDDATLPDIDAEEISADPVTIALELRDDQMPRAFAWYYMLCDHGAPSAEQVQQAISQRLERSFEWEEQAATMRDQIEAYQEYIYELQQHLKLLRPIQKGIKHLMQEVHDLKDAVNANPPRPDPPRQHATPSLAIRTLKRLNTDDEAS